jgi:hypothetical protein
MTDNGNRGVTTILNGSRPESRRLAGASQASNNLADLLERVLDKGIIIAGDITLCLGEIELLQIKIRLLIASVDKARDMGIDWWQHDPALSSAAKRSALQNDEMVQRLERLEAMLAPLVQQRAGQQVEAQVAAPAAQPAEPRVEKAPEPLTPVDVGAYERPVEPPPVGNGAHP